MKVCAASVHSRLARAPALPINAIPPPKKCRSIRNLPFIWQVVSLYGFYPSLIMNSLQNFALFIAQADGQPGGNPLSMVMFLVFIFVGMWFLVIAPQKKRQKQHEALVKSITSGTKVLTTGGLMGTVTNVKDDVLVVKIAENTKVEINRTFVHSVIADDKSAA